MRDNPDQPAHAPDAVECFERRVQCFPVERAKTLVDKDRVEPHTAGIALYDVAKPERKGKRGQKQLAAGKRIYAARTAAVCVKISISSPLRALPPVFSKIRLKL